MAKHQSPKAAAGVKWWRKWGRNPQVHLFFPSCNPGLKAFTYHLLAAHQWSEMDIGGCSLIMVDAALMYLAEVFYGDTLQIEMGVTDQSRSGCDFVFRLSAGGNGREVARVKTGIVFFDYQQRKVVRMPAVFKSLIEQQQ